MLSLELVMESGKAQAISKEGKKDEALNSAKIVERLFEMEKSNASAIEKIQTLASLARVYSNVENW